jgi:mannose-6-phosphate isomerase
VKLNRQYIEKPWGRFQLPSIFEAATRKQIGEVWFTGGGDLPLLAKYIFTSERLSIQVHPSDEQAHEKGFPQGKEECWYILDAEAGATIGLGFKRKMSNDDLRKAALDGSIEQLIDWRPVRAGDFFYVPAGTVHAIGAGISLLEFQQNTDVTYRLYDYGRPRELHLDNAVTVARPNPYPSNLTQHVKASDERILIDGPYFTLVHTHADSLRGRRRWVMPLEGVVQSGGITATAGEVLLLQPGDLLTSERARMLIGATI